MKKVIKLTESDIEKIVKRVISEDNDFSPSPSKRAELVDDVINRINEHGMKYIMELKRLNSEYPVEKYKRQESPRRRDFELPKGVKISKSSFPDDI